MREKLFYMPILALLVFGVYMGFVSQDPYSSRTPQNVTDAYVPVNSPVTSDAVVYVDSCNGINDTTSLKARGYLPYYRGGGPQGITGTFFQGDPLVFNAFNGPANGYMSANYQVVNGLNNIDSWLVLPRQNTSVGDSLYFWSRSTAVAALNYPDSIRVMYSANDSVPEGSWTELGRFRVQNVNPGDPNNGYVKRGFRAPTASANGRFAIRYCVANAGPSGSNSDFIGIDMITIERTATPPPASTWWEQTTPVTSTLASVSAADNNNVWACGYTSSTAGPPFIVRTTNGGTWTNNLGTGIPANVPLFNIWAVDANTALTTGSTATGTFVYRTTNGGSTWTQVFTQAGGFINVILMTDANNGWMQGDPVANRWSLWRTTNGGVNWDSTGRFLPVTGTEAGWNNSAAWVGNNMWFGTNNTKVYYSSNNGVNWTGQATTGDQMSYAVGFNGAGTGFAGGAAQLKMSTNNGGIWNTNTTLGTGAFTGIATDGTTGWWTVRQTGTGIYYSSNNGTAWAQQHTGPAGATYAHITKARNGFMLYAVRSNGGVSKWGPTTGIEPVNQVASDYKLSQNYPNPFNPSTKINFSLPKDGMVTLKVYDILGKEVATLVSEFKKLGTYAVDFNAASLASGIYLYKIQADGFVSTKRMMLVK